MCCIFRKFSKSDGNLHKKIMALSFVKKKKPSSPQHEKFRVLLNHSLINWIWRALLLMSVMIIDKWYEMAHMSGSRHQLNARPLLVVLKGLIAFLESYLVPFTVIEPSLASYRWQKNFRMFGDGPSCHIAISACKREPSLWKTEQTTMHTANNQRWIHKESWLLVLIEPEIRDS